MVGVPSRSRSEDAANLYWEVVRYHELHTCMQSADIAGTCRLFSVGSRSVAESDISQQQQKAVTPSRAKHFRSIIAAGRAADWLEKNVTSATIPDFRARKVLVRCRPVSVGG